MKRKKYIGKMNSRYACYEQGISGIYTEEEMERLYMKAVDKTEYPDYIGWKWDMIRSGVFEKI
ncbi:hypothetical protein INF30_11800 [Lachnospiraceae bacterium DSM 108991]|jgi:hypothetical protein|uniref:Uncharacterized protein n=1 Tax=Claveliimonas monacensis TaxID=2779351 RepID=A0ABR9RLT7_9FIRM|nr:hypothetical protein [Claveliimonas monacensis]MBE5063937.1 hypothetical protein [Claveliimonas monacensis]